MNSFKKNDNFVFIHAHNKQTLHEIVSILKTSSVPVAVITDFVILNSKQTFTDLIKALTNSELANSIEVRDELEKIVLERPEGDIKRGVRIEIEEMLTNLEQSEISVVRCQLKHLGKKLSYWEEAKTKGIKHFLSTTQKSIEKMLTECKEFGLFIVPNGELESWVPLGMKNKGKWIAKSLISINTSCPKDLEVFMSEIVDFLRESNRSLEGQQ